MVIENVKLIETKKLKTLDNSIYTIITYFVIYSILGFLIETMWAIVTKGTLESRKSFLYGPFCGIYGLGAVSLILTLQHLNKNNTKLFIGGFIVGSIVEYLVSLFAEIFFNVKWWDYSQMPFNINGRICLRFSIFWGFLATFFMTQIHPKIERLITYIKSKIPLRILKIAIMTTAIILLFDVLITAYALDMFYIRKVYENDLNVANRQYINKRYEQIYHNETQSKIIDRFFGDEKMIKTFPNLKTQDKDGNIIYFDCFVGDITPYYYQFNFK